jgi:hypothetical protein
MNCARIVPFEKENQGEYGEYSSHISDRASFIVYKWSICLTVSFFIVGKISFIFNFYGK